MKRAAFAFRLRAPVSLSCSLLLTLTVRSSGGSVANFRVGQSSSPRTTAIATETGIASYYGAQYHGKPTTRGEACNMNDFTAAHPQLAFGTRVKATHLESSCSVMHLH